MGESGQQSFGARQDGSRGTKSAPSGRPCKVGQPLPAQASIGTGGLGGWHKAMVLVCLPFAAPIGLAPLYGGGGGGCGLVQGEVGHFCAGMISLGKISEGGNVATRANLEACTASHAHCTANTPRPRGK